MPGPPKVGSGPWTGAKPTKTSTQDGVCFLRYIFRTANGSRSSRYTGSSGTPSTPAPAVVYEARPSQQCRELDFAVWIEGVARFGLEVKGGNYTLSNGVWRLDGPGGPEKKPNP